MRAASIIIMTTMLVVMGLASTNTTTRILQTTTRTDAVVQLCANFPSRDQLVNEQDKADGDRNTLAMKASFKASGNQLLGLVIKSEDKMATALEQVQPMYTELGFFIGPFVIGFIINLVIWMCLCCCCCCPGCCPSKCCQKPDAEPYTKCEMLWPSICLILALLLMIIASIIGITRAAAIEQSYQAVGCSAAITFDDVINGNKSSTGKFFVGLTPMKNGLNELKTQKTNVQTQMKKLSFIDAAGTSNLKAAYTSGTALLTDITKIPDGTANGAMGSYSYVSEFDGTGSGVLSIFPGALGHVPAAGASDGVVGSVYTAIKSINDDGLKTIGDNADAFLSNFGSIDTMVDGAVDQIGGFVNQVVGFNDMFTGMNDQVSPLMKLVTIGVTAAFGVFIGLGVLSIVGTLMMTFCDKYKCRYLLYFVCTILTVLGILCFMLTILFSIFTPIIYLGCDFLTATISSSAGFSTNLSPILGGDLTNMVGVCLPGGNGDIVNNLGIDLSAVNGLSEAVTLLRAFQSTDITNGVQLALNSLSNFIDQNYYTDTYDFSSTTSEQFLIKVASPNNAAYSGCSFNDFLDDKWVPSIRNSAFSCGSMPQASTTQCATTGTGGDIAGGQLVTGNTCFGCLDSTKIFVEKYTSAGTQVSSATADLNQRYGNPAAGNCAVWVTDMNKILSIYYLPKKNQIKPVQTRMTTTMSNYNAGYKADINTLGTTTFPAVITAMQGISSSLSDPDYGVLAGLNCLILGEDINLIANTTCAKLFNTFFTLRLTLGITAFGILFAMCCSTWSGVRHYKHSMRKGSVLPDAGDSSLGAPQDSTMMALNQKKY